MFYSCSGNKVLSPPNRNYFKFKDQVHPYISAFLLPTPEISTSEMTNFWKLPHLTEHHGMKCAGSYVLFYRFK